MSIRAMVDAATHSISAFKNTFLRSEVLQRNGEKLYLLSILSFYLLSYLTPTLFLLKILPLVSGFLLFAPLLVSRLWQQGLKPFWPLIWLSSFSGLAVLYLVLDKGWIAFKEMESFFFATLILLFYAIWQLQQRGERLFLHGYLLLFLFVQLVIMLGQLTKISTGYGFYLPSEYLPNAGTHYLTMLSGSFLNANDLAGVTLLIGLYYLFTLGQPVTTDTSYPVRRLARIGLLIALIIVILTASRSVMALFFITLVLFTIKQSVLRALTILALIAGSLTLVLLFVDANLMDSGFLKRILLRIQSLQLLLSGEAHSDNSIMTRAESYLLFLKQLPHLGFGTGVLRDYSLFVEPLLLKGPLYQVFAINPHSFIVEMGYWLGLPGLLLFTLFLTANPLSFSLLFSTGIFILASMASSSVINHYMFFISFFVLITQSVGQPASQTLNAIHTLSRRA